MVNRVIEPLIRSKMAIILEVKLCLSNSSKGIERQKEGTRVTLIFTHPDLFLTPNFLPIFANFQNKADCLRVNVLIDRDPK